MVWGDEAPIFEFDVEDRDARREFQKSAFVAAVTITGLWVADVRVLNLTPWGLALGPLRKFAVINTMTLPIYWYFYTSVKQAH